MSKNAFVHSDVGAQEPEFRDLAIGRILKRITLSTPRKLSKVLAVKSMLPFLSAKDRCLDVGTGHGGLAAHYSELGKWTFLDPDQSNLDAAMRHLSGDFFVGSLEAYRPSEGFELVAFVDTIYYFPDTLSPIQKISKFQKSGGYLLISGMRFEPRELIYRIRAWLGIHEAVGVSICPSADQIISVLGKSGYQIVKTKFYFGFFSQVFQTTLDTLLMRRGGNGDRLTLDASSFFSERKGSLGYKIFILRILSISVLWLDRIFFFFRRHAFVILARKV